MRKILEDLSLLLLAVIIAVVSELLDIPCWVQIIMISTGIRMLNDMIKEE